jgi:hypothetical protein
MEAISATTESKDVSTNKTIAVIDEERDLFQTAEVKTVYSKLSVTLMVIFSGLALGSDGFNASIIGNLSLIFGILYPDLSTGMYSRLSNAFIIGMIVGMLGFGYISDRLGRKSGAVLTTALLVLGIVMSAASSGRDELGMFWMLVISRGVAGVGAGGSVLTTFHICFGMLNSSQRVSSLWSRCRRGHRRRFKDTQTPRTTLRICRRHCTYSRIRLWRTSSSTAHSMFPPK